MASDRIDFTPLISTPNPSPTPVVFTAKNFGFTNIGFFVGEVINDRVMSIVNISFTDKSFPRNEGIRGFPGRLIVKGTSTYPTRPDAQSDLVIIAQMHGAECLITSTEHGVFSQAVCMDVGNAQIKTMNDPAYFINYNLSFAFKTV